MKNYLWPILFLIFVSCGVSRSVNHKPQIVPDGDLPQVTRLSDTAFASTDGFLVKNAFGLWEMYVQGDASLRGLHAGALSDSLMQKQEAVFFDKVKELVPSESRQKWLRKILSFYNRKLYCHVPEEYKTEIYGLSRFSAPDYDFIAPPYLRALYLHAAHDIGHAMQDLALVGCSSFAVWGDASSDGNLLIGRNFDFYAGDDFAEDKMVWLVKPDKGHAFLSVSWPGMMGVVSGMNQEGLSVTINAAKSKLPLVAKTPISILAREIVQYAGNIKEAIAIAKRREVFVSETLMIGSAVDRKAVLIEVGPGVFGVYDVQGDALICTNHYQSEALRNDRANRKHIEHSHSQYRFEKLSEHLEQQPLSEVEAVAILRDTSPVKGGPPLGFGNEKALNQLLAHHGIVFKPQTREVWVSSNPYQLGAFSYYNLDSIFSGTPSPRILSDLKKAIPADDFIKTQAFADYENYRIEDRNMQSYLNGEPMPNDFAQKYEALNPDLWSVPYKLGLYFYGKRDYELARLYFEKALTKEVTTLPEKKNLDKYLRKTKRKLK